jgi:hypothetical protein
MDENDVVSRTARETPEPIERRAAMVLQQDDGGSREEKSTHGFFLLKCRTHGVGGMGRRFSKVAVFHLPL